MRDFYHLTDQGRVSSELLREEAHELVEEDPGDPSLKALLDVLHAVTSLEEMELQELRELCEDYT